MTYRIYLDNNATTQLAPEVVSVMTQDLSSPPYNPSSVHFFGREAKAKLMQARDSIARFFRIRPQEILFTSGGTESMNFLIKGLIDPANSPHILTSNVEHSCVEKTLLHLQSKGCQVTFLPVGLKGFVSIEELRNAIQPNTKFLVFNAANSETGAKHDIEAFASLALEKGICLLVDAVAQLGKEPFPLYPGITGAGFSAHKIHGPKGVGFVICRPLKAPEPLLLGGGQEYGLRSGTENVTGILGLAKALQLIEKEGSSYTKKMEQLRDLFEEKITSSLPQVKINGSLKRICNVSNLCFPGIDAETLLIQMDLQGIAASQGSACSSGALEPSRILLNMGLSPKEAKSSIRFSLSRYNSQEEIEIAAKVITSLVSKLS